MAETTSTTTCPPPIGFGAAVRLAIADPPYLGRAALWYGGKGRSKQGTVGRAAGRGCLAPEFHPYAQVVDVFPGSGAVSRAANGMLL